MKTMLRLTLDNNQFHVACSTDVKTLARLKRVLTDNINDNTQALVKDIADCRTDIARYQSGDTDMTADDADSLSDRIDMQTDSVTFNFTRQAQIVLASTIDDLKTMGYNIEALELINY